MTHTRLHRGNTTVRLAIVVILLVLISAASMLWLLYQSTLDAARDALNLQQQTNANYIYNQIDFYQQIVDQLARRTAVKDLLNVGSSQDAMKWSQEVQSQLPNSIGLALIRPGVEIMGTASLLNLGKACLEDLRNIENQKPIPKPAVHLDNPRLAHFDLTSEVTGYDHTTIGTVFSSFSLDILQRTIESLTRHGQLQRIRDGQGRLLVQSGRVIPGSLVLDHIMDIPNTTWKLESRSSLDPDRHPAQQPLVIATLVITLVLVVVVSVLAWRSRHHGPQV